MGRYQVLPKKITLAGTTEEAGDSACHSASQTTSRVQIGRIAQGVKHDLTVSVRVQLVAQPVR